MSFDSNLCYKYVINQEFKSQYVYNKHNTVRKVYAYSIYAEISLVRCAHHLFDFRYLTNSCVNTVRTHFP